MEKDLIDKALEKLKLLIHLKIRYQFSKGDGSIIIENGKVKKQFPIEVKNNLRTSSLPFIKDIKKRLKDPVIITNYVSDNLKEELRKEEIFYLDIAGNAYIKSGELFILIQGQKEVEVNKPKVSKAFNAVGLKIIFAILENPEMINFHYRYISNYADVSLGSVATVLNDLKEQGYILEVDKNQKKLNNRKELFERWIIEYGDNLKPKLFVDKFRFIKSEYYSDFKFKIKLNTHKTVWGGEAGADILTAYLKPEKYILYSTESKTELMKKYKLVPDKNGDIEVYKPFYPMNSYAGWHAMGTAHPFLVYADLMLSNDPRNIETAKMIYEKYFSEKNKA